MNAQRLGAIAGAALALSACGSSGTATPGTPAPGASAPAVTISNFAFAPGTITVQRGQSVTFTNGDAATHTVTADDGSFDSGNLSQGKGFTHTFSGAGTFRYHCAIHQYMTGTVTVTG